MSTLGPIEDKSRVVIVGGGPAGVSCALALQRMVGAIGRRVSITIVEGKEFSGERHYNQCVGVLSPPLVSIMQDELDLLFPQHLARGEITGYILHSGKEELSLTDHGEPSVSLRRVQFDAYMLDAARERGVDILNARAVDIEFHHDHVVVYTENAPVVGDVVVGAFGLDEGSATMFSRITAYNPPRALTSVVTKYHPGPEVMETFGNVIHAFLPRHPRIEFAGVTPKGNHLTINIAGRKVDTLLMRSFLDQEQVRRVARNLDMAGTYDSGDLRFFKGRFPCSLAQGYYGDRYVMVGDSAGLVRAFKGKGVTSAILTGVRAARTMLEAGISRRAFESHYRTANKDITSDIIYGQLMRSSTIWMARTGLMESILRAAESNPYLKQALYDAVSGEAAYRNVLTASIAPRSLIAVFRDGLLKRSNMN
jgi:flavin-dependent dehydrogenase